MTGSKFTTTCVICQIIGDRDTMDRRQAIDEDHAAWLCRDQAACEARVDENVASEDLFRALQEEAARKMTGGDSVPFKDVEVGGHFIGFPNDTGPSYVFKKFNDTEACCLFNNAVSRFNDQKVYKVSM